MANSPVAAPIITLASALAHAAQLPQQQAIRDAQQQADAAANAQTATVAGYTHALAPILAAIAPAVQQGYTQAANEQALLGKAFGGQMQTGQDQAAQQLQGLLNSSGGQAQAPSVQAAASPAGIGNALGWLHGGLPAQGLNQAGAAFGAAARQLPAEAAGVGQQQIGSILAKQQLTDQGFQQKLNDLAAQYPGLFLKTENQVANQAETQAYHNATLQDTAAYHNALIQHDAAMAKIAQQRNAIDAKKASVQAAYDQGQLSAKQYANQLKALQNQATNAAKQESLAIQRFNATTSRIKATTAAAPKPSASLSRAYGYRVDQYGNMIGKTPKLLPGFTFDKTGNVIKAPTGSAKTKAKTHGLTQVQVLRFQGVATTLAENAFNGFTDAKGVVHPALSYQDAILEAQKEGLPNWIYQPALDKLYQPGEKGRPVAPLTATGKKQVAAASKFFQSTGLGLGNLGG